MKAKISICSFLVNSTALVNKKWGGACVNILECLTGGEAEEVVLNTSSTETHLSSNSQLTRNMLFLDQLILPGSHWGRQTAAGCRWCLRRSGIFSDLSSLSPLRHPAGQPHSKFSLPSGRKAVKNVKLTSQMLLGQQSYISIQWNYEIMQLPHFPSFFPSFKRPTACSNIS